MSRADLPQGASREAAAEFRQQLALISCAARLLEERESASEQAWLRRRIAEGALAAGRLCDLLDGGGRPMKATGTTVAPSRRKETT